MVASWDPLDMERVGFAAGRLVGLLERQADRVGMTPELRDAIEAVHIQMREAILKAAVQGRFNRPN